MQKGKSRQGFTLIELMIVVVIMAILSGILLPALIKVADKGKKKDFPQNPAKYNPPQEAKDKAKDKIPSGVLPILDIVDWKMTLQSSYHRIELEVYTRYQVDCRGKIFLEAPEKNKDPLLLFIPFPDNIVEARDVEIQIKAKSGKEENLHPNLIYRKEGIYCLVSAENSPMEALVSFTAFGRERFDYSLPPAKQLRTVDLSLNISGASAYDVPDEALQPTLRAGDHLKWSLKNLVSDRRISVLIPGAQAPLSRVLLLLKYIAVAVLLFGAGFWFLSEQAKPGLLDNFRVGHFFLLALTYSLFFIVFTMVEFQGILDTYMSIGISALFSLPLLLFHISRVLNFKFALTRVVPLYLFTLGLVINGVYGEWLRDYIFTGSAIFLITYITLVYETWTAQRKIYHENKSSEYLARRKALREKLTLRLGGIIGEISALEAQSEEYLQEGKKGKYSSDHFRLDQACGKSKEFLDEHQRLMKELGYIPNYVEWGTLDQCKILENSSDKLLEKIEIYLKHLKEEISVFEESRQKNISPKEEKEIHCMACGKSVPVAPFCQQCGCANSPILACKKCKKEVAVPLHLLRENAVIALFCSDCGQGLKGK